MYLILCRVPSLVRVFRDSLAAARHDCIHPQYPGCRKIPMPDCICVKQRWEVLRYNGTVALVDQKVICAQEGVEARSK